MLHKNPDLLNFNHSHSTTVRVTSGHFKEIKVYIYMVCVQLNVWDGTSPSTPMNTFAPNLNVFDQTSDPI